MEKMDGLHLRRKVKPKYPRNSHCRLCHLEPKHMSRSDSIVMLHNVLIESNN